MFQVSLHILLKVLVLVQIGFTVTKKDKEEASSRWMEFKKTLRIVWPHAIYYIIFITAIIFFIVR